MSKKTLVGFTVACFMVIGISSYVFAEGGVVKQDFFDSKEVKSDPKPQKGQKHRSSENFGTNNINKRKFLEWNCKCDNNGCDTTKISFDVKKDKSEAIDPIIFKGVKCGDKTKYVSHRNLYIADPQGVDKVFNVTVTSSKGKPTKK